MDRDRQPPQIDASVRVGKGAQIKSSAIGAGAHVTQPSRNRTFAVGAVVLAVVAGVVSNEITPWVSHVFNLLTKGKP